MHQRDAEDGGCRLGYRCAESGMTIAVAADHLLETETTTERSCTTDDDLAKMVYRVEAEPGQPIRLTKTVAYHTSRGVPPRELLDRCDRTLDRAPERRASTTSYADQRALARRLLGVAATSRCAGQPELQQAMRWNLFPLAQASARADGPGHPGQGRDRLRVRRPLLLGHRDLRRCRS